MVNGNFSDSTLLAFEFENYFLVAFGNGLDGVWRGESLADNAISSWHCCGDGDYDFVVGFLDVLDRNGISTGGALPEKISNHHVGGKIDHWNCWHRFAAAVDLVPKFLPIAGIADHDLLGLGDACAIALPGCGWVLTTITCGHDADNKSRE